MHGAIDAAWDGHRWRVMELNVWFPVPPKYSLAREHGAEELADVHRRSIADLLGDAARDVNRKYQQRNASHKNWFISQIIVQYSGSIHRSSYTNSTNNLMFVELKGETMRELLWYFC